MKALYQDLPFTKNHYVNFYTEDLPHFIVPWHYHPEVEIMYITEGYGTRYVGDNIGGYEAGDICLVGSNLPHEWKNDPVFFQKDSTRKSVCKVLFFREEAFESSLTYLPEMETIKTLLERAKRGILFEGKARERVEKKIREIYPLTGIHRICGLLELLDLMADQEQTLLASVGFTASVNSKDFTRFNKVYEYLVANYTSPISLQDVAALIGLTPQAFCKYFKARTGSTFIHYLNGMRIGHAKKMLIDGRYKTAVICSESGFNNQSHFIHQFKIHTGLLPTEFQAKFGMKGKKLF